MTAHVAVSCDGHRHGQPCRGALNLRTLDPLEAGRQAGKNGWRTLPTFGQHLCPSPGHDEEEGRPTPKRCPA